MAMATMPQKVHNKNMQLHITVLMLNNNNNNYGIGKINIKLFNIFTNTR